MLRRNAEVAQQVRQGLFYFLAARQEDAVDPPTDGTTHPASLEPRVDILASLLEVGYLARNVREIGLESGEERLEVVEQRERVVDFVVQLDKVAHSGRAGRRGMLR